MDRLLGQFRRVKAEIQRMKPREAPKRVEEPPAVEATIEPELTEEPILEEIAAEEPELEELAGEALVTEEIIEDEPILEEIISETEIEAVSPEEEPLMEELVGEEAVVEEVTPEELDFMADLEEEPILEEPVEEEPALEAITAEELTLEEEAPEEPTLVADLVEEPILEEPAEEEPALEAITAEELTLEEEAPEEKPSLALDLDEEPSFEELFDEEPMAGEAAEEEVPFAPLPDEEPDAEELFGEEFGLEGLPEEEPVLKPVVEPEELAPAPGMPLGGVPASLQNLVRQAKDQGGLLANAVSGLTHETEEFFGRILKAMSGKPSLSKLEKYFASAHHKLETRISQAQELSGNLIGTLAKLEKNLGQKQAGRIAPHAQAEISSQVKTIKNAIENISQAASKLQRSLTREAGSSPANYEAIAFKDAQGETEEFSFESDDLMGSLDSEPVLDLVEEIPAEPLSSKPGTVATIYLADVANNTLGVPTEAVANVFKLTKGKAKAIRKRGYVRLTEFKGAFRSIKRGVTGPLADSKPKELKKIQFPLIGLSPKILGSDDTEAVAPVRGIVLLSTGQRHGALLTDEVMQRTPYDVKGYQKAGLPGEVSGTATIEGDFEINVIDPNYLLS
jgi:hypothetical protein